MRTGIQQFIQTCSNVNVKLKVDASHRLVGCGSKMKNSAIIFMTLLLNTSLLCAQSAAPPANAPVDYSGMYAFLQEGEFVQLTVEDQGIVTGLISRYGDSADKHEFIEQFFKDAKLEGKNLTFTTKTLQNVWYEFQGTVERGDAQNPGDEGYYVLKGRLIRYATDTNKKTTSKSQDVALKSFPKDLDIPLAK